jgi:uncharacterized damage-inducible protein DinB
MKWFERKFNFDVPVEMFPNVLERLRGTAARIEEKLLPLPADIRTHKNGDAWSIQEHAGHLLDLDELHFARLLDYEQGAETLRPADLQNRQTFAARHNERQPTELCAQFRLERDKFIAKLESWPQSMWGKTALHPRLKQPMRVLDLCIFVAEHDDHHLAIMTQLARQP